jgi:Txe/YoeB family toxin of Txe-Axe toxin-antitoxin module
MIIQIIIKPVKNYVRGLLYIIIIPNIKAKNFKGIEGLEHHRTKYLQGWSRETSSENFFICNPKYKKPLGLNILFNSK